MPKEYINIRKSLLQFVFSGSFMKRWNDKLRPMELVEVEKQAHKMMIAFILLVLNTKNSSFTEQTAISEEVILGGIFDYFYRLIITDIKPPIFYKIKSNPAHFEELTSWVLEQIHPKVEGLGKTFWQQLEDYFAHPKDSLSHQILTAAHLLASRWEFHLIKGLNHFDPEMQEIEDSFSTRLKQCYHLKGVQELTENSKSNLSLFMNLCGQLRFQKRWSQTPRIPETSVLGHLFIVASYAYFFSLAIGACPKRRQNNFFAGLFHDIPELLTRDIISPVKQSVDKIGSLIREYEENELEKKIFSLLKDSQYAPLLSKLKYFLGIEVGSEFTCTIINNDEVKEVTLNQLQTKYNHDQYEPKDGELLKVCDSLAAFIEAYTATRNGIMNEQLQLAQFRIKNKYQNYILADLVHIGAILSDFD
ncbi:MAG: HD domain-containing protein [Desulfonauticus sp.]|nr:HD domain-containing protein [Desulfonauticus sp.]